MFTIEDQKDFTLLKYDSSDMHDTSFSEVLAGWNNSKDRETRAYEIYHRFVGYTSEQEGADIEDNNVLAGLRKVQVASWEKEFLPDYAAIPKILFNKCVSSLESMSKEYDSIAPGVHNTYTDVALYMCNSYSDVVALIMHYRNVGSNQAHIAPFRLPTTLEVSSVLWLKESSHGVFIKKPPFIVVAMGIGHSFTLFTGVARDANTVVRLINSADLALRRGVGLMPFPNGTRDYSDSMDGTCAELRASFMTSNKTSRGFNNDEAEDCQSWLGNLTKLKIGIDRLFQSMTEFGPKPLVKAFIANNLVGKLTTYEQKQKKESDQWFHMLQVGKAGQADNEPQDAPKEQGDT